MDAPPAAEVGAIADGIDSYRCRVAGLAEPLLGSADRRADGRAARGRARLAHRPPGDAASDRAGPLTERRTGSGPTRERWSKSSLYVRQPREAEKWQRPLAGPSLCDARRRIPASPANQVAGTWLVRPSYTRIRSQRKLSRAPLGQRRFSNAPPRERSTTGRCPPKHMPHTGVSWRRQTRRPCRIRRRLNGPHSAGGR